jgi:hypothetical protein
MPKDMAVALVSDHGFERTDNVVNLRMLSGDAVAITPFLLIARSQPAAAKIRKLRADKKLGIGREVPLAEFTEMSTDYPDAMAVWEPAEHFSFSAAEAGSTQREKGNHGLWPTRPNYRSVFVLWGSGIQPAYLPEMRMIDIAQRLAEVLGVSAPR